MSNEKRILLTLVLSLSILMVYEALFFTPQQEARRREHAAKVAAEQERIEREKAEEEAKKAAELAAQAPAVEEAEAIAQPVIEEAREIIPLEKTEIENDLWRATLSNRGGVIESWQIKDYYDDNDKNLPKELVHWKEGLIAPMAVTFGDFAGADLMYKVERVSPSEILFKGYAEGVEISKRYIFKPEQYYFDIEVTLTSSAPTVKSGDLTIWKSYVVAEKKEESSFLTPHIFVPQAMCYNFDGLVSVEFGDLTTSGSEKATPLWGGISEQYFILALAPSQSNGSVSSVSCISSKGAGNQILNAIRYREISLKPGETKQFKASAFIGPKKIEQMKALGVELDRSVDWGMLGVICRPMLWLMKMFFSLVGSWGIAIMLLTLVIKLLLFPITHKSFKSMRDMQALKPEMDKLKEKYKDDKNKLNQEMMTLYREKGINPLGGCLPILLQMPIWFALYRTIYTSVDLYQARFIPGWLDDLAAPDPYYILPLSLAVVMFAQQAITPTTMDNAQAKIMKWFMPPFFALIMLSLPSGLNLYIFANSILSIFQQMLINKMHPIETPPKKAEATVKPSGGKKSERKRKQKI